MSLRDLHRQLLHDFNEENWLAVVADVQRIRRLDLADYQRIMAAIDRGYHNHEGEKTAA
jgi:hypothetical protein